MTASEINPSSGHDIVFSPVYGPVKSRRYGTTFGINLLPSGEKTCSFDCLYCQLGWSTKKLPSANTEFPVKELIAKELARLLTKHVNTAPHQQVSIVFSGNGEPTLHPDFANIVSQVIRTRDEISNTTPIVCFTNGTTIQKQVVFDALSLLEECCVKLDPQLAITNSPPKAFSWPDVKNIIVHLNNLVIQSCVFGGLGGNDSRDSIEQWVEHFSGLNPRRVDLYTISRQTPHAGLIPTSKDRLTEIKNELSRIFSGPITITI
ncbi:MAG: hypothetical protein ACD_62C00620G0008 [uncultured bacterium]|nr:MAG: hypothetical protein ACD_62C00620G0008 [uncultured bacterium]HLD45254.1 radical SAM protein [bacterium]